MKNIEIEREGSKLTLVIDLDETQGPSKSGKNIIIATTGGNQEIGPGIYLGANVYRKI